MQITRGAEIDLELIWKLAVTLKALFYPVETNERASRVSDLSDMFNRHLKVAPVLTTRLLIAADFFTNCIARGMTDKVIYLLPPANEIWGKVIFLHLFVILFGGGARGCSWGACVVAPGGVRGCSRGACMVAPG